MKELCIEYVKEKVEKVEVHNKFLAPDGIIRLLVARDYVVKNSFEMFQKWVVSYSKIFRYSFILRKLFVFIS